MEEKENIDLLSNIFNNINYWLDYAEKKSSYIIVLFTVLSGFVGFILNKLDNIIINIGSGIFFIAYIISIYFILISLKPYTNKEKNNKIKSNTNNEYNLLFFGDISKCSYDDYKNYLMNKYNICTNNGYILDLINQIVNNSKIVNKKFNYLKKIAITLEIGIGIYIASIIGYIIDRFIIQ